MRSVLSSIILALCDVGTPFNIYGPAFMVHARLASTVRVSSRRYQTGTQSACGSACTVALHNAEARRAAGRGRQSLDEKKRHVSRGAFAVYLAE
jgi:hypothetical protein